MIPESELVNVLGISQPRKVENTWVWAVNLNIGLQIFTVTEQTILSVLSNPNCKHYQANYSETRNYMIGHKISKFVAGQRKKRRQGDKTDSATDIPIVFANGKLVSDFTDDELKSEATFYELETAACEQEFLHVNDCLRVLKAEIVRRKRQNGEVSP